MTRLKTNAGSPSLGSAPIEPIAACRFWACTARATSAGVRPSAASFAESSHTRIEYCSRPKIVTSPTPSMRWSAGAIEMSARLVR